MGKECEYKMRNLIPALGDEVIRKGLIDANISERKRSAKILHAPGAEFNEVFNFIQKESYMQPHCHPGSEKIEFIHLVQGKIAIIFFDKFGAIDFIKILEKKGEYIEVPAFSWHTYVMLSESVITYETMMGVYDPDTWKSFASWAPVEGTKEAEKYLQSLRASLVY